MLIKECCVLVNDKIDSKQLNLSNYISTENLKINFGGFIKASSLPNSKVTKFKLNDILLSNIRPYFKKGMFCELEGGCSNDVFCIRNISNSYLSKYIFYSLTSDNFINALVSSCKGTKMPRGDKNVLLNYNLADISIKQQQHIVNSINSEVKYAC